MSWFGSDKEEVKQPKKVDPYAWELLEDEENFETWRRKVPGGWLVRAYCYEYYGSTESMTFVSDPNYTWRPK